MLPLQIWFWQRVPALRLLTPFVAGILLQWHIALPEIAIYTNLLLLLAGLLLFPLLPLHLRFKAAPLQGAMLTCLLVAIASLGVQLHNVRHHPQWFGKQYGVGDGLLLTLQEPLVEKPNSFKALAKVEAIIRNDSLVPVNGKLILYFKKEDAGNLKYGSQVWAFKNVVHVTNSGNPAGFDYERYSLFSGITHQAYLTAKDYVIVPAGNTQWYRKALFGLRQKILTILRTHIIGERETGLAEALLIGYKDDLDKTLVQAYSNTGVVHIIAISGLHVGLIYGLLLLLTQPLRGKKFRWLRFLLVLTALWVFGVLAGAQPSVLRSVVMFSFIAAGTVLDRNTSVYNNLALSALLLLCYNPFWLWDAGFQLSYAAVSSIIIFYKPVYNWLYLQNKLLDAVWKLMAVTMAAQILTTPLSLYYFHQFPLLFLFTNIIAVPLSSIILFGEILVCAFFFIPPVASATGWATTIAIRLMNGYIEQVETISYSLWQGLSVSAVQALLLLLFTAGISVWLLEKKRAGLWFASSFLLLFTALRSFSFFRAAKQQQLVVYNIAKHQAIDLFNGRQAWFIGDKFMMQDEAITRFHLQPNRTAHRITAINRLTTKVFVFGNKRILILDTTLAFPTISKCHIDLLILSKNPKLAIKDLATHFDIAQVVTDASVPAWKATRWQQDCDSLRIPCHNVRQKGAFVMTVPRPTFAAL